MIGNWPTQSKYWSATTYAGLPSYAWNVFFGNGIVNANSNRLRKKAE